MLDASTAQERGRREGMHSALVTTDMVSEHFKVACDGYPGLKSVDIMNDGTAYGCFPRVFSASICIVL